jgi:hypothetical protein
MKPYPDYHTTEAKVICLELGKSGYTEIFSEADVDDLNYCHIGVEVIESALAGSMFGWNIPAAKLAVDFMDEDNEYPEIDIGTQAKYDENDLFLLDSMSLLIVVQKVLKNGLERHLAELIEAATDVEAYFQTDDPLENGWVDSRGRP